MAKETGSKKSADRKAARKDRVPIPPSEKSNVPKDKIPKPDVPDQNAPVNALPNSPEATEPELEIKLEPETIKLLQKKEVSARQLEDKMLVQRARAGDEKAFFDLVKRHRHGVERLIRPMVRTASSDEFEDLVQEALTKALLHLNSYSEEYAFSTWLYRIATNHAIDYLRRRKLNAFSISAPPMHMTSKSEDDSKEYEIADRSWVPEDQMLAGERTRLIEEAIEQLPENYKRIIKLRHSDDMEYEEIARVLQIPMGTVKVHLHRARAALARILEGRI